MVNMKKVKKCRKRMNSYSKETRKDLNKSLLNFFKDLAKVFKEESDKLK